MLTAASLTISRDPLILRSNSGNVYLSAAQAFTVVTDEKDGGWRVSTRDYIYRLDTVEHPEDDALLEWHWHPPLRQSPHTHVLAQHGQLGQLHSLHLPSSRVSFEAIVRFMIDDLGVRYRFDDWSERLDRTEAAFRQYRSWH